MSLSVVALNCTLKPSPAESSCELLLRQALEAFARRGVPGELLRMADFNIKPGVTSDEGDGDEWPQIRARILSADILLLGTPIWLGHPSSICQRVMERLDALLGEMDDQGRMLSYGKVAGAVVVGNEDGAHHVSAAIYQGLSDVGFSIPANAVSYWVGEAMKGQDYKELSETPEKVAQTTEALARNCSHLAKLLKASPYPGAS